MRNLPVLQVDSHYLPSFRRAFSLDDFINRLVGTGMGMLKFDFSKSFAIQGLAHFHRGRLASVLSKS